MLQIILEDLTLKNKASKHICLKDHHNGHISMISCSYWNSGQFKEHWKVWSNEQVYECIEGHLVQSVKAELGPIHTLRLQAAGSMLAE